MYIERVSILSNKEGKKKPFPKMTGREERRKDI